VEALVIGTALALGALAFVLYPVFRNAEAAPPPSAPRREPTETERAVDALREVEFDRATGKLSDEDYAALRSAYTAEAVEAMRAETVPEPQSAGSTEADESAPDPAEALIRRYRSTLVTCPACGVRPEPAAAFCSICGRRLGT
jgi:hypothetical protein